MKKLSIIIATLAVSFGLVACSGTPEPAPTVTVIEQAPQQNNLEYSTENFIDFVEDFGGIYGSMAPRSGLLEMGNAICDGFRGGLSEQDIIDSLIAALIDSDMANDNGTKFAASLMAGAETFLCPDALF